MLLRNLQLTYVKVTKKDYWKCDRCGNTTRNSKGTMIPCPRGGCDAKIIGEIITKTETEIRLFTEEEIKILNDKEDTSLISEVPCNKKLKTYLK